MTSLQVSSNSEAIEGEVISPSVNTSVDYKQILVQVADGSTWKAKLEAGELVLIEQLHAPSSPAPAEPEDSEEESEDTVTEPEDEPEEDGSSSEPAEEDEQDDEGDEEPEDSDSDWGDERSDDESYDDLFNSGEVIPSDNKIDKVLSSMKDVTGVPEKLKDVIKDPAFRARLSSVMLDNKYDRRLRGRTRGKLDMTRLHKAPTMARNLFTQKQSRRGKNYNVTILLDQSGSMIGSKIARAAESIMLVAHSFDKLNINLSVIGFTSSYAKVYKDWEDKLDMDDLYRKVKIASGGNADYDAMHFALDRFKQAPDGENVFIMMSDGIPSDSDMYVYSSMGYGFSDSKGKPVKFTTHDSMAVPGGSKLRAEAFHKLVKSYPDVHSVGIGILEGGWQVPEHDVIHNIENLKRVLVKLLSSKIKRG